MGSRMFEAVDGSKIIPPKTVAALPSMQVWSYVTRINFNHWFYVVCASTSEDYAPLIYFMQSVTQLLELNLDNSSIIEEAYIVSPSKINKSKQWKMSSLKRILKGNEPNIKYEKTVYIYELEHGDRYVDSMFNTKEDNLLDINTLCEFPTIN
jgi:hypothetical protein